MKSRDARFRSPARFASGSDSTLSDGFHRVPARFHLPCRRPHPMNAGWFLQYHEIPELLEGWLTGLGVRDAARGARPIDLARRAGPARLDRIARIVVQLDEVLPRAPTRAWP